MSVPGPTALVGSAKSYTEIDLSWSPPGKGLVAVGANSGSTVSIATSPDGITWTSSTNNPFSLGQANDIAYSPSQNKWVAVGNSPGICIATSPDGMTWTDSSNNPFSGGAGYGIAWSSEGSKWVVVGQNYELTVCIATSPDGMTWTDSSNNPFVGSYASAVAYSSSQSQWVAVGAMVGIATSPDGMTWTDASNNPFSGEGGLGIAYSSYQNKWVAVGYNNPGATVCIATSTDGMTWTDSSNNPFSGGQGLGIAYSSFQDQWVAVGRNSGDTVCIAASSDGMTWTDSSNNPFFGWFAHGIEYSPSQNQWIAVGGVSNGTVTVATSPDGMTWTPSTNNPFPGGSGNGIAGDPITITSYRLSSVSPPLSYTLSPSELNKTITGLTPGTSYTFTIRTDISGSLSAPASFGTLTTRTVPAPTVFVRPRVTASELQFWWTGAPKSLIAVGNNSDSTVSIATSQDGLIWTPSTNNPFSGTNARGKGIAWSGSYFVSVGKNVDNTVCIATSTDGMTWTDASNNPFSGGEGNGIAWNGAYWVAVGGNSDNTVCIAKSYDGMTWTDASNNPFSVFSALSIAWYPAGSVWFATSRSVNDPINAFATSPDGMTWTIITTPLFIGYGVAWNDSYLLAVGGGNETSIIKSFDGINWSPANNIPSSDGYTYGIGWNGSYWLAVGQSTFGFISKSYDGVTWIPSNDITLDSADSVTWNGSRWVVVGNKSSNEVSIITSSDGITWTASTNNPFDGGSATGISIYPTTLSSYILASASPALSYTLSPNQTTAIVTGLTPLTDYSFTIKSDISGNYSAVIPFRTVRTSTKPLPVTALASSQTIVNGLLNLSFTWINPDASGSAAYAYYYAYGLRGSGSKETIYEGTRDYGTTSHTFTGLDPVRAYTFRVQQGNDAGYSEARTVTSTAVISFDPRSVAGLKFWGDSADVANGTPVSDGVAVNTWADKSGAGNDAGSTVGAVVGTDSVGRFLQFNGTSAYNFAESIIPAQYFTFFIVDRPTNYTGTYTLIGQSVASSFSLGYDASGIAVNAGSRIGLGSEFQSIASSYQERPNIWCFTSYGAITAYWNKMISGQDTAHPNLLASSRLSIGSSAAFAGANKYSGKMREILIYSGIMSELDREAIQNYLYDKWSPAPPGICLAPVPNGVVMWLDAQDTATMFQDVSGNVPINSGGIPYVQLWKDKSGFGNDLNNIEGGAYIYNASNSVINNLPSVIADGSNPAQTANHIQTGDATVFIVADGWGDEFIFTHDVAGNFALSYNAFKKSFSWHASPTENNRTADQSLSDPYIFCGTMQKGQLLTSKIISYFDETTTYEGTTYTIDTLLPNVGSAPIKLSGVGMRYGEVIYYNRCLSEAEIQKNTEYLLKKWKFPRPTYITNDGSIDSIVRSFSSGLQLWLDSSDPYTVFEEGGALSVWKDKSGRGNHASANNGPSASTYSTDGIYFDGSGQWLSLPNGSLPAGHYSYYIVSNFVSDSAIVSAGSKDISGQIWVAVGYPNIAYSFDGMLWTASTNNPFSGGYGYEIAYSSSQNKWVAVGNNSGSTVCIASSPDGITWTASTNNPFSGGYGYEIAYSSSQNKWVAVGQNSGATVCIATSPDGITWTDSSNNPFSVGGGSGIAYSPSQNKWVAVGYNSDSTVSIASSPDGMTWTDSSNNPFSGGVAYGITWSSSQNKWVAVGYNSENTVCIATSPDGMTWTDSSNNPFSGSQGFGIAYSPSQNKWVAVGYNSDNTVSIARSADGMTWTDSSNNPFSGGVAYGITWSSSQNKWVAVGYNSGYTVSIATSPDGMTWTDSSNNPFSGGWGTGIASGPAPLHNALTTIKTLTAPLYFYVASGKGEGLMYSSDGTVWTKSPSMTLVSNDYRGVIYGGGLWLAVGDNITTSTDGITWTIVTITGWLNGQPFSVAYGGGKWVVSGSFTSKLRYSTDTITWIECTDASTIFDGNTAVSAVAYGNNMWVACSVLVSGNVGLAYSSDGITWTASPTNESAIFGTQSLSIAYGNGKWVVGCSGSTSAMVYSTDGMAWTVSPDGSTIMAACTTVAYGNGLWVAGGDGTYTLAYSTDGITWTGSPSGTAIFDACDVVTYNGKWMAAGTDNQLAYSTDGMFWTASVTIDIGTGVQGLAIRNSGTALVAQTAFDNDIYDASGDIIPNSTILNDINAIPVKTTVIIESIHGGTGKSLYLSGLTGATDTSSHMQDTANNFIGRDLSGSYMHGSIKEILVYNTAHDDGQRLQVETYLKKKWYPNTYVPTGPSLWLEAAQESLVLIGNRVQTWKDKSPYGVDVSQNIIWAQPQYTVDSITGFRGLQFGSEGLRTGFSAEPLVGATSSYSVFAVQRYDFSSDQDSDGAPLVCTTYATAPPLVPGFLAVGYDPEGVVSIVSSTDGMTWTAAANPFGGVGTGISYNGSYWVAVGYNAERTVCIASSTDGMSWTNAANPFSGGYGQGIAWSASGSYWVAVGANADASICIAKSTDGLNWTPSANPFSGGGANGIAYSQNKWVAVGRNLDFTVSIATSTDGMTWTVAYGDNLFIGGSGFGIAYSASANKWIAVGANSGNTVCIATSPDGMTWTDASNNPFSGGQGLGIAYSLSQNQWIAVGYNSGSTVCIATSQDGMTWTDSSNNPFFGGLGYGISYSASANKWIAVGRNAAYTVSIATSPDGMTWTPASNNLFPDGYANGVAEGNILATNQKLSVGTSPAAFPNTNELTFNAAQNSTTVLSLYGATINKRPVLTSQVVNSLKYSTSYNGNLSDIDLSGGFLGASDAPPLHIGFSGDLTPNFKGAMRGYIYEMLVYNRPVGREEQQAIEAHLAWKYGIQEFLPTTSPYFLSPPEKDTVPFTPFSIDDLVMWLDGADAATIDLSGSAVTQWADKSGSGNNATGTGSLSYSNNSVVFDGSTGSFTTPYTANPAAETVFVVMRITSQSPGIEGAQCVISGTLGESQRQLALISGNISLASTSITAIVGSTTIPSATNILYDYTLNAQSSFMYYNGVLDVSGVSPAFANGGTTTIGNHGANGSPLYFLNGSISELLIFKRVLTTVERQIVEGYLAWKWSIEAQLPAGHPYYSAPPSQNSIPMKMD